MKYTDGTRKPTGIKALNRKDYRRQYNELYRKRISERHRLYRELNGCRYWKQFGGTREIFKKLWKKQNGLCALCDRPLTYYTEGKQSPLDHCHETLKIRGILCHLCNTRLGWLEQRSERIFNYLGWE